MAVATSTVRHVVASASPLISPVHAGPVDGRWLQAVRWVTCTAEWAVVAIVWLFPAADLPLRHVVLAVLASAICHTGVAAMRAADRSIPTVATALSILVDVVLLTGLLEITGGPFNPFTVIYGAHVALGWFTLSRRWGIAVAVASGVSYTWLVYDHLQDGPLGHHRLNDFPTHLFTMWLAAAVTTELVAFFAARARAALAERQRDVDEARTRAARSEHLASLTTLAAGAAHELSTPLATIAVAAKELERVAQRVEDIGLLAALRDDAGLIRTEVSRCQSILDQMSGRATEDVITAHPLDLGSIPTHVRQRLTAEQRGRLRIEVDSGSQSVAVPAGGVVRAVASLVKNAFDASEAESPVTLRLHRHNGAVRIEVQDNGKGLTAEGLRRAGEPFYTTKEPGKGLGLGLFLARTFAEEAGGSLRLESGEGTTAILELPAVASQGASA